MLLALACAGCGLNTTTIPPAPTSVTAAAAEATATGLPEATPSASPASPPALACNSPAPLTPAMTEGPYYTPDSPERSSLLEAGIPGEPLLLTGYVLTADCQPVPGALLDFWQADGQGVYDNTGYGLRGRQYTDEAGRYTLETVVPGLYPGRTAHIHVKVQPPGGAVLTTQVYFPGTPGNESDAIFDPRLLVTVLDTDGGTRASFDFVVSTE
jgi:protocatechuate 3,4-dioxygenase beta subunit